MHHRKPEELEVDLEDDRDYSHNLVGCKIRAFYDDQCDWFLCKITCYNTKMAKTESFTTKKTIVMTILQQKT